MAKNGYVNGSDLLLYINGKAVGHCTTHTTTFTSDTKERSVKPVATKGVESGLWKGTGVTGLSISIKAEGLNCYDETESSYAELVTAWKSGKSVTVKCMERENSDKPYLEGAFIISQLERTDPAQDDSTYSLTLDNDGEPTTIDAEGITVNKSLGS